HFLYQQVRFQEQPITDKLTPAERGAWSSALEYYKQTFAKRDLLFDEELVKIKDRLSDLASSTELKDPGLPAELIKTLEQVAPVYRKYWWPEHERANQEWIKNLKLLLQRFAGSLTEELGTAYREKWPDRPM